MAHDENGLNERLKQLVTGNGRPDGGDDLEGTMKQVSLLLSVAGFALMVAGLILMLLEGVTLSSTDISALSPFPISEWTGASPGLAVTSLGIILLALLPIVRVLLALRLYWQKRDLRDAAATLVVFLELVLSIRIG
jgi:uncharacterized membrane protein